jgi:hypothetical protein
MHRIISEARRGEAMPSPKQKALPSEAPSAFFKAVAGEPAAGDQSE